MIRDFWDEEVDAPNSERDDDVLADYIIRLFREGEQ